MSCCSPVQDPGPVAQALASRGQQRCAGTDGGARLPGIAIGFGDHTVRMTIVEMLDVLENEIARLRADRTRLVSALEDAERRLNTAEEDPRPRTGSRKRSKRPRRQTGPKINAKPQTPSPAAAPPESTTPRAAAAAPNGKRIALGRGLAQLRRKPAPEGQKSPDQTT